MNEETDSLRNAAEVLSGIRQEQAESQKPLYGMRRIAPERLEAIHRVVAINPHISAVHRDLGEGGRALDDLFERFEEMCRRRKVTIPEEVYPMSLKPLQKN